MATRTPAVVDDLRAAFARNWRAARPLAGVVVLQ
jgi:hypothetical protein